MICLCIVFIYDIHISSVRRTYVTRMEYFSVEIKRIVY